MRFPLTTLLLACAGSLSLAQNATVTFFAGDFTGRPQAVRRFAMFPVLNAVPAVNSLGLVTGDFVAGLTDTNGNAQVTNVLAGTYRLEFHGATVVTTNYLLIPSTTNTVNAANCITLYPTGLGLILYEEAGVLGGRILFEP